MIQIHQFSTGIKADKDSQGRWISRGFTGRFMNLTLPQVPEAVQRSIRNKEFAVAEGAYSDDPALVARVVLGDNSDGSVPGWSVVATVTRGRDEYERPFSAYRYFLCEGTEDLWQLLDWLEQPPSIPVFDPFEAVQKIRFTPRSAKPKVDLSRWLTEESDRALPVILPPGQIQLGMPRCLQTINQLAVQKGGDLAAWALNVEALEQPHRFAVVQVASERAGELLRKAIAMTSLAIVEPVGDEQAIKSAIKSLTSGSLVKPDAVQVIVEAMANPKITVAYWQEVFDGQGAGKALKQKLFSPQMVRLLTLRALIVPQALPEFLIWLNPQLGAKKQGDHCETSLEFQSIFYQQFPKDFLSNFEQHIKIGVEELLLQVMKSKVPIDAATWSLIVRGSFWSKHKLVANIGQDLTSIRQSTSKRSQSQNTLSYGDDIWKALRSGYNLGVYEPLAVLFRSMAERISPMECSKISAYFYQTSIGKVPDEVFIKAFPRGGGKSVAFGMEVEKEVTLPEKVLYFLYSYGVFILIPLILGGGGWMALDIWSSLKKPSADLPPNIRISTNNASERDLGAEVSSDLTVESFLKKPDFQTLLSVSVTNNGKPESKVNHFYGSDGTCVAVGKIIDDFSKEKLKSQSLTQLVKLLRLKEDDLKELLSQKCKRESNAEINEKETDLARRWIASIYLYQDRLDLPKKDGVINLNQKTQTTLKCDVAKGIITLKEAQEKKLCPEDAESPEATSAPPGNLGNPSPVLVTPSSLPPTEGNELKNSDPQQQSEPATGGKG